MIRSMTGFGRGQARSSRGILTVELRSVNHRFLEVVPHLPAALQPHEEQVRALLRRQMQRGRVTSTVTLRLSAARAAQTSIDVRLARQYHHTLTQLIRTLRLPGPVTLEHLLGLPRVVTVESVDQSAGWWPTLAAALTRASRQLLAMRAREGRATARELLRHVGHIDAAVEIVAARAPHVVTAHRERLLRRLQDIAPDVTVDPQRVASEVALFAANIDIAEELARLRSHVAQFRRAVAGAGEQGRALDFIAQEMFRETNTIGSKANDYAVTAQVIVMKGALDKLREHVQNVE